MKPTLTALILAASLASAAQAQDLDQLPDDQLLGAVVTATDDHDADRLLELMLELQARGLLMFRQDNAVCDAVVPRIGLLENMLPYGNARQAYITAAQQAALEQGDCRCPFDVIAFDTFLQSEVGSVASDIDQGNLRQLRDYRRENESRVDREYRDFRRDSCGKP